MTTAAQLDPVPPKDGTAEPACVPPCGQAAEDSEEIASVEPTVPRINLPGPSIARTCTLPTIVPLYPPRCDLTRSNSKSAQFRKIFSWNKIAETARRAEDERGSAPGGQHSGSESPFRPFVNAKQDS